MDKDIEGGGAMEGGGGSEIERGNTMDLSELGVDVGVSSGAVLATLRTLVEVMNGGVAAEGEEPMEARPPHSLVEPQIVGANLMEGKSQGEEPMELKVQLTQQQGEPGHQGSRTLTFLIRTFI